MEDTIKKIEKGATEKCVVDFPIDDSINNIPNDYFSTRHNVDEKILGKVSNIGRENVNDTSDNLNTRFDNLSNFVNYWIDEALPQKEEVLNEKINNVTSVYENLNERVENLSELVMHTRIRGRFYKVVSAFALIGSVIAICTSLKSFSLDSAAYLGWVVASFSTILVVLMGWQIFNIIEFKGYKEEIREMVKIEGSSLRKQISEFKDKMDLLKNDLDKLPEKLKKARENEEYINQRIHRKT